MVSCRCPGKHSDHRSGPYGEFWRTTQQSAWDVADCLYWKQLDSSIRMLELVQIRWWNFTKLDMLVKLSKQRVFQSCFRECLSYFGGSTQY